MVISWLFALGEVQYLGPLAVEARANMALEPDTNACKTKAVTTEPLNLKVLGV